MFSKAALFNRPAATAALLDDVPLARVLNELVTVALFADNVVDMFALGRLCEAVRSIVLKTD